MASVTVATVSAAAADDGGGSLTLDSIPAVDLDLLTQSELYALSLCSSAAFDLRRADDVVSPKLDRSVFNESAGSRKQTYSRLRLAPAASPSSVRGRRPRLRPANHNLNHQTVEIDPENLRIVSVLKQLFQLETNTCDLTLTPVPVESIPVERSESVALLPTPAPVGVKRKRGRPRKDRNVELELKSEAVSHSNEENAMRSLVVYENAGEVDKGIVSADGVVVDLGVLGSMEDPFAVELRRRTEGIEGDEQLLGFLQGLNGEWVSRRRKRRIVDASEFGNVFPKDWKLMLSLKRKTGHVWVYCRRYISPSGRHFISCKEVSTYLLSLRGELGTTPFNVIENTKSILDGDKPTSFDTKKENIASHASSARVSNMPVGDQMQDMLMLSNLQEVRVGEISFCENCNLEFDNKDDLVQHQLICQLRTRPKIGQSITDGVIIKDGKFECQFCHKSFDERLQYNDHVCTHVKNHVKSADVDLQTDSAVQEPIVSDQVFSGNGDLDAKTELNSSPHGKFDNQVSEHLDTFDKSKEVAPVDLISTKSTGCFSSEPILSNDENAVGGCSTVAEDAADKANINYDQQGGNSDSCSRVELNDKLDTVSDSVIGGTSHMAESEKVPVSGSGLHHSAGIIELCNVDEVRLDKDRPAMNKETTSGLCINSNGLDENTLISEQPRYDSVSCREVDAQLNSVSESSILTSSAQKRGLDDCVKALPSDVEERLNNSDLIFSSCVDQQKFDGMSSVKTNNSRGGGESNNHFVCDSSWGKNMDSVDKYGNQFPDCFDMEPRQQKTLESNLLSLPDFEKNDAIENYVDNVSTGKVDDLDINELQSANDDELIFPFSSSNGALNTDSSADLKQDRSVQFFSLFADDNDNESCKTNVEMYQQEPSETAIHPHSFVPEASNQAFTRDQTYTNSLDGSKQNGLHSSAHQDLNLNFRNPHVEIGSNANTIQLQQEGYPAVRSNFQLGLDQTYGAQTSLHNMNHSRVESQKQGVAVGVDLQSSSFNNKVGGFGNNYNMVFPNSGWGQERMDGVGHFGKNLMPNVGNNVVQPNKNIIDSNIWRTNVGNVLNHNVVAANANPMVQPSNCFQNYNIMSDKGENMFKARSEPVEYSFMGTQNLNCNQHSSAPAEQVFSYNNVDMGGFNSSFWLGKNGSGSNISGRNVVATVCIWCSSTFYQEAIQPSTQAAGSMCPNCCARIQGL